MVRSFWMLYSVRSNMPKSKKRISKKKATRKRLNIPTEETTEKETMAVLTRLISKGLIQPTTSFTQKECVALVRHIRFMEQQVQAGVDIIQRIQKNIGSAIPEKAKPKGRIKKFLGSFKK